LNSLVNSTTSYYYHILIQPHSFQLIDNTSFLIHTSWSLLIWITSLYSTLNVLAGLLTVVATTHWNGTCSLLTSAKLLVGYLVVGITRELDKEPSLHCSSIYINYMWSVLQQYLPALMSMPLPHVLLLRPPYCIHMPWCHTLNLRCICVHHVHTIRNHSPLMSSLILTLI